MDPITGAALIGGGASLLGGVGSAIFGASQSKKQMKFQTNMSNTAYQRAMRDMEKAGLNPILAYQKGGASTPGGSVAPTPDFSHVGSSASQMSLAKANIGHIQAQTENARTQNSAIAADARLKNAQANLAQVESLAAARSAEIGGPTAKRLWSDLGPPVKGLAGGAAGLWALKQIAKRHPAGMAASAGISSAKTIGQFIKNFNRQHPWK